MNFFSNTPNNNPVPMPFPNNYPPEINQNIFFKINDLENKIRKLEQRIANLENENHNVDDYPPDNSLYMI